MMPAIPQQRRIHHLEFSKAAVATDETLIVGKTARDIRDPILSHSPRRPQISEESLAQATPSS